MKPRSKLHHRVIGLSRGLPLATREQKEWAFKHCFEHKAFRTTRTIFCLDCGRVETLSTTKKQWVCPGCGTRLNVTQTKARTDHQFSTFGIMTMVKEFQVVRIFEMRGHYRKGEKMSRDFQEIVQYWILPGGKYEIVARNHTQNWYFDSWNGALEIRDKKHPKYHIGAYRLYPKFQCIPELRRNGFRGELYGAPPVQAIEAILTDSYAETLLKARQPGLFRLAVLEKHDIRRLWSSVKICLRNKYKVVDAKMWADMINMLRECGKDIRNAKYVCPKDLKAEHDRWVEISRRQRERRRRERERLDAMEDEARYYKAWSRFFDIEITNGEIVVMVLPSVKDVMEEGDALHHCVFASGYHRHKDSLLMSARLNGQRLETIEFSLKSMEVVQCRGLHNQSTEHHDTIVALVNKHKHLIRKHMTA